ncbi:MAG: sensor histidine kinase, partial [Chitinimonas sp.]|nr:sensor histidine kinase [Chitinimonas sp.]
MLSSLLFTFRLLLTWGAIFWVIIVLWSTIAPPGHGDPHWLWVLAIGLVMGCLVISAASHKRRVRLIAGRLDGSTLSNRQRRQIEIPLPASEAFELVDAA